MRITLFLAAIATLVSMSSAHAQEYLDTAGRWKTLSPPVIDPLAQPRTMIAHSGHVVIGTQGRHAFVSRDSGETWIDAGAALPPGFITIWSLAFPDSIATPMRILGVATTDTPIRASLIESSDGGVTWRETRALPELDSLFALRPLEIVPLGVPVLYFVKSSAGGAPAGFLHCGIGLLASSDGGTTWTRRASGIALRALEMSDELNGVASFIEFPVDTTTSRKSFGGIAWTSDGGATWTQSYGFPDGGFFQYHMYRAFSKTEIRAFIPERYQNFLDWPELRSSDGGRSWGDYRGLKARRPLFGSVFWRDTTDMHVICDGAIVQHSADGGEQFFLLRDTAARWSVNDLDYAQYVAAPISASDGRYIYLASGRNIARWRMADLQPRYVMTVDERENATDGTMRDAGLRVAPNPVCDHTAQLFVAHDVVDLREIAIVDVLGRVRAILDAAGRRSVQLPHGLPAGAYTAIGRGFGGMYRVGFVVAQR